MTLAAPGDGSREGEDSGARAPTAVVLERSEEHPRSLLGRLGIGGGHPRPVIVVSGGADDLREPELSAARAALGPAIRAAVASSGAAIVDGGTDAGVMALLGAERAGDPASIPVLIGVAPSGKVEHPGAAGADAGDEARTALAPHHTHVVLADSDEWGGETPLLAAVAAELAHGEPVVLLLAGGGDGARAEVREAVARGWPVFVIQGTGGLADQLAATRSGRRVDPELVRMLEGADVRPTTSADAAELGHALTLELRDEPGPRDEAMLKQAWGLFATYDELAVGLRRAFERYQVAILALGVVATAVALAYDALADGSLRDSAFLDALKWFVIAVPITVSVLIALANRRDAGKRWVLVRAAAETAKSEIYRYRTRTGVYSREALRNCARPVDRPQRLAGRLSDIESGLIQTPASSGPLTPSARDGPPAWMDDDGFSRLDAEGYMAHRVADQVGWYHRKVDELDRRRRGLQLLTLVAGGVGTLVAAVGLEVWIGVTTAIAGGAIAYLGYLQIDNTIVAYNRAAAGLRALQRELGVGGGRAPDLERLVTSGETILTAEVGAWVQQMTEALAELQVQQTKAGEEVEQQRDKQPAR